jgi:hypothetical protein
MFLTDSEQQQWSSCSIMMVGEQAAAGGARGYGEDHGVMLVLCVSMLVCTVCMPVPCMMLDVDGDVHGGHRCCITK